MTEMKDNILYQGHASIRICAKGKVIYVDPFAGAGYDLPADILLMSHEHPDHCDADKVPQKDTCKIISHHEACINGDYKQFCFDDIKIITVPAYNKNHPKDVGCVGFLICFDEVKIYVAADTSYIEEMHQLTDLNITYAFLPCDGYYNMDVDEASLCASIINAQYSIPYHTCRFVDGDFCEQVAEKFSAKEKLLLHPMETIVIIS